MKKWSVVILVLIFGCVVILVFKLGGHKQPAPILVVAAKKDPIHVTATAEDSIFVEAGVGDVAKIRVMLAADSTLVDAKTEDDDGMTPLMFAAKYGNLEVVKLLMEKGAKVDGKSINGHTPLMFAAEEMQLDVVKLLIEKGANTKAEGQGLTAGLIISRRSLDVILGDRNIDDAIVELNMTTTSNPRGPMAFRNRGLIYAYKKQYDKSSADYSKAIDLLPSYSELYDERGGSYAENGDYDLAIADFNKAVELNVQNVRAYFLRGSTNLLKGKKIENKNRRVAKVCFQEAVADFTKTIELQPDNRAADLDRRLAYEALASADRAK